MATSSLIAVLTGAVILQAVTLSLWLRASIDAHHHRAKAARYAAELNLWHRWGTMRSPRTGRYMKKEI